MAGKLRFLAVDDDPAFLLVLAEMMRAQGYEPPETVMSGQAALTRLSDTSRPVDCILLDVQMPGIDGIETCRRIRALRHHRHTPIMMITTLSGRDHVDQAFEAGATDYLTKPLHRIDLAARLGMMERLVTERAVSRKLQQKMETVSDLPGLDFSFRDAVPLPQSDQLIDYLALQNHLLTLNRLSLHAYVAMAFQVEGAVEVYENFDRVDYLDFMGNVGSAIAEALKTQRFLLAHAGAGEFMAVLHHGPSLDRDEISQTLGAALHAMRASFFTLGLPLPSVRVGAPQRSGIFSISVVEGLLSRARRATRLDIEGRVPTAAL